MLNASKAFSSFSVSDIQKAKEFYGTTLELELDPRKLRSYLVLSSKERTKERTYEKSGKKLKCRSY